MARYKFFSLMRFLTHIHVPFPVFLFLFSFFRRHHRAPFPSLQHYVCISIFSPFYPEFPSEKMFLVFLLWTSTCTFCLKRYCQISKSRYPEFQKKYLTSRFILKTPIICIILTEKTSFLSSYLEANFQVILIVIIIEISEPEIIQSIPNYV